MDARTLQTGDPYYALYAKLRSLRADRVHSLEKSEVSRHDIFRHLFVSH